MAVNPEQLFGYLDNIDSGLKACQLRVEGERQLASVLNSFNCRNLEHVQGQLQTVASPLSAAVLNFLQQAQQCPEFTAVTTEARGIDLNYVRRLEAQVAQLQARVSEGVARPSGVGRVEETAPTQDLEDEINRLVQVNRQLQVENARFGKETDKLQREFEGCAARVEDNLACCQDNTQMVQTYRTVVDNFDEALRTQMWAAELGTAYKALVQTRIGEQQRFKIDDAFKKEIGTTRQPYLDKIDRKVEELRGPIYSMQQRLQL